MQRPDELAASYGIACVPKPFDLDALVAALDRTIAERLSPVPPSARTGSVTSHRAAERHHHSQEARTVSPRGLHELRV